MDCFFQNVAITAGNSNYGMMHLDDEVYEVLTKMHTIRILHSTLIIKWSVLSVYSSLRCLKRRMKRSETTGIGV